MDSEKKTQLPWPEVIGIDVQVANLFLNQGRHRYLDVRAEEDFRKGHVVNALHIPYYLNTPEGRVKNPEFVNEVSKVFGKEDHFIVGCGTGNRSVLATNDLRDAVFIVSDHTRPFAFYISSLDIAERELKGLSKEFNYAYSMLGGYKDWAAKGFPVNKSDTIEP